jgi:hypothetical protein
MLDTFSDYILFRGSLEDVVAEGRFTADWKLPEPDERKMASTGSVEVRQ